MLCDDLGSFSNNARSEITIDLKLSNANIAAPIFENWYWMNQDQTGSSQKGKNPAKRNQLTLPFFGSQLSQHSVFQEKWASLIGTIFFINYLEGWSYMFLSPTCLDSAMKFQHGFGVFHAVYKITHDSTLMWFKSVICRICRICRNLSFHRQWKQNISFCPLKSHFTLSYIDILLITSDEMLSVFGSKSLVQR